MSDKPIIFLGDSVQIIEIKEICDLLQMEVVGIIDNDYFGNTPDRDGIPYIGSEKTADWEELKTKYDFFIPINPVPNVPRNVDKRKKMIEIVEKFNLDCVNIIDPECRISPRAKLGKGIYMAYTSHVAPNAEIGDHCQIHFNAGVAHNVIMGKNTTLQRASVITGEVVTGENVYIGFGAKIMQVGAKIGKDSCINSGVMIFRDVAPGEIVNITGKKIYPVIADFPPEIQ